jgi:putative ABC transport system permease protein
MLLQDIRYAIRTLLKSPGFTAVAVLCLSLGIGVNATIFSVIDGIILQPSPYPDADQIIVPHATNQRLRVQRGGVSFQDFEDVREANSTLSALAAFSSRSLTIADGSADPERYTGLAISWNLFALLGTPPALGRGFRAEDDRPGAEPVVLLSDDVWRLRYHAEPNVIGRATSINGRATTIVGVMPPGFRFAENHRLWVPLATFSGTMKRGDRLLQLFARMKPGVTLDQARADLSSVAASLEKQYPTEDKDWSLSARPLVEWMLPAQVKLILSAMMGAVTLVLLIACSNVANLLLVRASVRQREITIRTALGAGRWRIVRQLLTEAVAIGLFSAPLGIAIAWLGTRLLTMAMPVDQVPYFIHWKLDERAILYTVAVSMLTGLVFGLAPAVQAARGSLQASLKEGGRGAAGSSRAWLRSSLVVVQVALSLVLLAGASMFVHSFLNLQTTTLGFDTAPLMSVRFFMPGTQYESADAKAHRVEDIVARVEALPGVQSAFASNFVPVGGGGGGGDVIVEGKPVERGKEPSINFVPVSTHLRRTLGVDLVRGRDLTDAEGVTKAPVAVINQAMAKRLWPDADPIGRRFRLKGDRIPDWFTVVGIVADFRHFRQDSDQPVFPAAYVPYPFDPTINTGLTIRVNGDPARITPAVREAIRASDPLLPMFQVSTIEQLRQLTFWQDRLFGIIFSVFGVVALLLAAIGVYGVLSYSVSQRTQEIGVRVALGAGRGDVVRLVVAYGLWRAGIGVALGLLGAPLAAYFVRSELYNVTPTDPVSLVGVSAFLALTAFVASYIPARRATAVDPIIALRNE